VRLRLIQIVVVFLFLSLGESVQANEKNSASTHYELNIPRQTIEEALNSLAKQTSSQILFSYDLVETLYSNPIQGAFTLESALKQLLKGTALSGGLTDGGAIIITPIKKNNAVKSRDDYAMNTKKSFLASVIGFIVGSGGAQYVVAQDNEGHSLKLEEIVVTGSRAANRAAIDVKERSSQIMDAIGADDIGSLPDLNIADSFRRIPGINTINETDEGKYVTTRGLDGSLNLVTIDGMTMASDNRDTRRVNMEAIPPMAVTGLEVYKTLSPNMDHQTIGGQLNMKTRSAYEMDGRFFKVDFSLAQYTYDDVPDDDDKISSVAGLGYSDTFGANDQFGVVVSASYTLKNRDESYAVNESRRWLDDDQGNELTPLVGRFRSKLYTTEWERMGAGVKFEYKPNERLYAFINGLYYTGEQDERRDDFYVENRSGNDTISLTPTSGEIEEGRARVTGDDLLIERVIGGAHFHVEYELDDLQQISFDGSSSRAKYDQRLKRAGWTTDTTTQLGYQYSIGGDGFAVWDVNNSEYIQNTDNYMFNEHMYEVREQRETVEEIKVDYRFNVFNGSEGWGAQAGLKYRDTDRSWNMDRLKWKLADGAELTMTDFIRDTSYTAEHMTYPTYIQSSDAFYSYYNANSDMFELNEGLAIKDSIRDNFRYNEEVTSAYIMARYATEYFTAIAGVRYEATDYSSKAFSYNNTQDTFEPANNGSDYDHILPSVTLTYQITDDLRLRAAYSKSLGRPDASSVTAKESVNENDDGSIKITLGNPNLKPRQSDNYDLSLEYYFDEGDSMLSAAIFNKQIENLVFRATVETFTDDGTPLILSTYQNSDNSQVSGLELSFIKNSFDFMPEPFDRVGLSSNFTWIDAEMDYVNTDGETETIDHLLNQTDFMANIALFYALDRGEIRVAYNHTAGFSRGLIINGDDYKEQVWDDYGQLDLQLRYDVSDNIVVTAKARNITDEHRTKLIGENQDLPREVIEYGSSYWLGVSYTF
jgi:iron complex outermembrane recepter protein